VLDDTGQISGRNASATSAIPSSRPAPCSQRGWPSSHSSARFIIGSARTRQLPARLLRPHERRAWGQGQGGGQFLLQDPAIEPHWYKVARNRYHATFTEFRAAVQKVLNNLPAYRAELASLLTERFQLFTTP